MRNKSLLNAFKFDDSYLAKPDVSEGNSLQRGYSLQREDDIIECKRDVYANEKK